MSKLTLLTMLGGVSNSVIVGASPDDRLEGHVAAAGVVLAIFVPHAWAFALSIWKSCYRSRKNNPNPSYNACFWTLVLVMLEVIGVLILCFVVAPRCTSVDTLVAMNIVFVGSLFAWMRQRNWTPEMRPLINPLQNFNGSLNTSYAGSRSPGGHDNDFSTFQLRRSSSEMKAVHLSFVAQLLLVLGFPVYLYFFTGTEIVACVLLLVSVTLISVAWIPHLQALTIVPTAAKHNSFKKPKAQIKTAILANFLRVVLTVTGVFVLFVVDDAFSTDELSTGLSNLGSSAMFTPFMMHIFTSFVGDFLARACCVMDLQIPCYSLPLALATPITLVVLLTSCGQLPWAHVCVDVTGSHHTLVICLLAAVAWASEQVAVLRTSWRNFTPVLPKEETLFYHPWYHGVLLEQALLMNRRYTEEYRHATSVQDEPPRVYICSTMYREAPHEMRKLLESIIELDAAMPDVFESHVFLDGGIIDNAPGEFAIQLVKCLGEELSEDSNLALQMMSKGQIIYTPYGGRLEFLLPNGTPFIVHLKDGKKVKNKKRWSQVMYMYYFLQFRAPKSHAHTMRDSFIMTTDADVSFHPQDVQALIRVLSRDKNVGAVCGRTYPRGSGGGGPVVWYVHRCHVTFKVLIVFI